MNYPTLSLPTIQKLEAIKLGIDTVDGYLDKSPYGADFREVLAKLFSGGRAQMVAGAAIDTSELTGKTGPKQGRLTDNQAEDIEQQANELLSELKNLKPPAGKGFDHDTKIQIIKAKTALIDKVVGIQERAYNVRKVSTFQKVVVDILRDLVDPDRINEFQDRLGIYL